MSYTMTQWQNGQEPAINAENLNKIERGIYDAHQTAEGKYSKPSLGIPKNDLAESVKNSLDNADSALQDDDVDSDLSLISVNPVQNKVITNKIAGTDRRLDALYNLTQGQAWDFDRDNNNAYSVDVTSGAKYASVDMVGGKSVVWNQLVNTSGTPTKTINGTTFTNNGDGTITVDGTAESRFDFTIFKVSIPIGHIFLNKGCPASGGHDKYMLTIAGSIGVDIGNGCIFKNESSYSALSMRIDVQKGAMLDNAVFIPQLFDLTAMFGAGNEPSTVEEFEAMFPNDYYEYCEPTIISSQTDRVDVKSSNLIYPNMPFVDKSGYTSSGITYTYDENRVVTMNGTRATSSTGSLGLFYYGALDNGKYTLSVYDEYGNYASDVNINANVTPPHTFTVTDSNRNALITIVASIGGKKYNNAKYYIKLEKGAKSTPYNPHIMHQITTNFPTLNSAGSVYDYIDLNEGKLHQRVGKAVFDGSEAWGISNAGVYYLEKANLPNKKQGSSLFAMSNRYSYGGTAPGTSDVKDGSFVFYNNSFASLGDEVYINDTSLADVAALKASLASNPLTIIYELTEEIVTDIEIPAELADWLTVEAGGSITFHNADESKRLLIPSTEEYLVKLSEVISNG